LNIQAGRNGLHFCPAGTRPIIKTNEYQNFIQSAIAFLELKMVRFKLFSPHFQLKTTHFQLILPHFVIENDPFPAYFTLFSIANTPVFSWKPPKIS
jgi:hypothetical protein